MKRIGIAFLLALVVVGVAWVAADAAGSRGPKGPHQEKKCEGVGEHPEKSPLMNSEEFKAEKERHQKAMEEIMAEGKKLRAELRKEVLALWEKNFPGVNAPKMFTEECGKKKGEKPSKEEMKKMREEMKKQGEKFRKLDKDKMKKFWEEAKKVTDAFAEKNKVALKKIAGKAFDEKITHRENVISITKNLRSQIIDANYKKVLMPKMFRGMRQCGPQGSQGSKRPQGFKGPKGPQGSKDCQKGGPCPKDKN